ncbi:hypothetical protein IAE22_30550, partial [Bacillus sp. S34]|nr:hypothetical protein [Bacillus sp. S34]
MRMHASVERTTFPVARRFGLGVLAAAPLAGGWLAGAYRNAAPTFVVIGTAAVVGSRTEVIVSGLLAFVAGIGATAYLALTGFRFLVLINGPRDQAFLAMAAPVTALLGVWAGGVAVRAFRSRDRESERRAD